MSSDDSEHHSRNRHVLIISSNNCTNINDVEPSFRHVNSSVNKVKSNNYSKNADAIIAMLGIRIALHYGGGSNNNAADVQKEIRCTFENIMSTAKSNDNFDECSINDMLYENGVECRVLGFGDPFHIANLCVTWASVYAFGDTKRADHTQVHHRQLLQSLHSLHTDNIPFSQAKMGEVKWFNIVSNFSDDIVHWWQQFGLNCKCCVTELHI